MIKLACNYYHETEELVRESKIDIDYFKFPSLVFQMGMLNNSDLTEFGEFVENIKEVKPILLHGLNPSPHNIGSVTFIEDLNVEIVNKLLHISETPGISLHLAGIDKTLSRIQNLNIIIKNINYLKEKFPNLDFLSFENVDSNMFGVCIEPDFISTIIKETNVQFLLDISHAFCSARVKGENFEKYLYQLPLDNTYEIHINGWAERNNDIMCHIKINELGYRTLKNVLSVCSPKIVTLEYGRHNDRIGIGCPIMSNNRVNSTAKEEIIEQVDNLKQILNR